MPLDDPIGSYYRTVGLREPPVLARLREETAALPNAGFQITPEQGQLLTILMELLQVRHALEIGVYTGYSSLAMALGMPMDGRLIAVDKSAEWTAIARRYWKEAGIEYKIDLRLGDAKEVLEHLHTDIPANFFDFVFIDADKERYDSYFEHALHLARVGGLIAIDNTLLGGSVADPAINSAAAQAVRELNQKLVRDERVSMVMLPMADGMTLARKRE
jgi:caffeoyl-CoA O-methyltransferase